ncbi:MAG: DNA-binding protein [Gammaproteobacteria bacterium]|nr:DNA-binding protein [Gammaproteobacteria bacterium]
MKKIKKEEIKRKLYSKGMTIKQWANDKGYPVAEVYKVLNGERKGLYGKSYQIAKDLGLWG